MKFNIIQFSLAGGIIGALCFGWTTLASLIGIPGFLSFGKLLEQGYGFYGYSLSWIGVLVGAFWGFVEGIFWFGIFAYLYNTLHR